MLDEPDAGADLPAHEPSGRRFEVRLTGLFKTDQPRELAACLAFCAEQAERAAYDDNAWRWLTIGMVLAVQNACLCALDAADSDGTATLRRADARARARARRRLTEDDDAGPAPRIVSPLELLQRVADHRFLPPPYQLPLSDAAADGFDALVDLRNTFLHFSRDGWTLELSTVPPLVVNAARLVRHLSVTQPAYLAIAGAAHATEVADALDAIVAAMEFQRD